MTFASFQGFGKWDSRRQWLNKCAKCTKGLVGRCLRHSFGMLSIPQAFLNFKEFINFYKSHGLIFLGGLLSTGSSRAWTLASTRHSWFSYGYSTCLSGFYNVTGGMCAVIWCKARAVFWIWDCMCRYVYHSYVDYLYWVYRFGIFLRYLDGWLSFLFL
jgi:hypothetical protein